MLSRICKWTCIALLTFAMWLADFPANRLFAQIPADSSPRDHVYIFFVDGLDPFNWGNLHGLAEHIQGQGFKNTYHEAMWNTGAVREEILRVRAADRDAHFVLLGFSFGAVKARNLAHQLENDGVALDLLVYLGGDLVFNEPRSRPQNCQRVLNITSPGPIPLGYSLFFRGGVLDGAKNVHFNDRHITLPGQPRVAEMLLEEIGATALSRTGNAGQR